MLSKIIGTIFILLIISYVAHHTYEFIQIFEFECILLAGTILLFSYVLLDLAYKEKKALSRKVSELSKDLTRVRGQNITLKEKLKENIHIRD